MIAIEHCEPSALLNPRIRARFDTVLLAFSAGKDSILAWLVLRAAGIKVVPYYCYLVPNLEFVETSIRFYEEFFGQKILRLPHPSLYRMWRNMVFMPPERCAIMEASSLPQFSYADIENLLRADYKLDPETPTASGVRAADSIVRRIGFKTRGSYNTNVKKFYPVWDWTIAELEAEFIRAKVALPVDYWLFGRSFDGLDYRFLEPISRHFPADYRRILECFPLAELELKRKEYA